MNKLSGNHPSLEALAEFAEGRSPNPAAIEAHLDTCESCALDVLAGREAIALESLGADELRMTSDFEARARRQLLAVVGSKGPPPKAASRFGALGAVGLFGGLGGLGSVNAGPERMVAGNDHPEETRPFPENPSGEGEISGHNAPSDAAEDDVSRMLDHIHDVLDDPASDHPGDSTDPTSSSADFSSHTDSTTVPDVDIPPVDHGDSFDHGASDDADHHHDNPLDHGDSDDDFPG